VARARSRTTPEDVRLNLDAPGGDVVHFHDDHAHGHEHHSLEAPHVHDASERHAHVEVAPTLPSRAVVVNVGEHTGALVLESNVQRSGIEVEIHPVSRPEARTHVWVLPREGRDGIVYAAIFPSLASGDYAILDVDGSIAQVVSVPANEVTHTTWT
jgi:hypothetical protein